MTESTPPPLATGVSYKEVAVFSQHRYGLAQPHSSVDVDTVITYGLAMAKDAAWRPGFTEVWDLRFSGPVDIRPRDISMILELEGWTKEELAGSETIIIADRGLLEGIVHLYAMVVKPFGRVVQLARSGEAAAAILGISEIPALTENTKR